MADGLEQARKLSVLMELRPALDEYAGIPQETRLLFALFRQIPSVEVAGLILHGIRQLPRGITATELDPQHPDRDIVQLSRAVIALAHKGRTPFIGRLRRTLRLYTSRKRLRWEAQRDRPIELTNFVGSPFRDFVWEQFFAKTLTPDHRESVTGAPFALMTPSYRDLQSGATGSLFPIIDTRNYDVFLAQTPWPSRVHPRTRLVVRYHDAIPMLLPHTISSAPYHQNAHYTALVSNAHSGIFVCNSEHTRGDLLTLFPQLESRSTVIHDVVSSNYFKEAVGPARLRSIVRSRLTIVGDAAPPGVPAGTERPAVSRLESDSTLNAGDRPFPYILVVSTIEPRKNYARAVAAWARARSEVSPDLKLVIVGGVGWSAEKSLDAMRIWQERGDLFHLTKVPTEELRALYAGATATFCPSVDEGFDLSGIEAMLCGSPVVASDIPVHREIYGEACLYCDPYSTEAMGAALGRIAADDGGDLRRRLTASGERQAERYRPDSLRPQWANFYKDLQNGRYGAPPGTPIEQRAEPVRRGWLPGLRASRAPRTEAPLAVPEDAPPTIQREPPVAAEVHTLSARPRRAQTSL